MFELKRYCFSIKTYIIKSNSNCFFIKTYIKKSNSNVKVF